MNKIARLFLLAWVLGTVTATCAETEEQLDGPSEYYCPITHEVMTDPVLASDGFTYQREAIQNVFSTASRTAVRSPMTNEPLENLTLIPNRALKALVNDWIQKNKPIISQEELDSQVILFFAQEKSLRDVLMFESDFGVMMMREIDKLKEQNELQTRQIVLLKENLRGRENPNTEAVPRPVVNDIVIPEIARGCEEVYRRFVMGKLIYKPDPNSNNGKIKFSFRLLANSLEETFDLSQCGDSGQHLSISIGYRKCKNAENANKNKVEIWLAPRFLIEKNLGTTASHYQPIMADWNAAVAPVGVFWDWGTWDNLGWFDYLTSNSFDQVGDNDLHEKWRRATSHAHTTPMSPSRMNGGYTHAQVCLSLFTFHF